MRITSIKLTNFKRFSDLIVRDIPETAKLVVVVGPNGCGKSSLFDALLQWYRSKVGLGRNTDKLYYQKSADESFGWDESVAVTVAGGKAPVRGNLYVRTAYRNDPDFSTSGINRPDAPTDETRFSRVIENDATVSNNYQRLVYDTMAAVYDEGNDAKTVAALREELIGQVRSSMQAVFGDLVLNNISDPLGAGAFYFDKGTARSYHYKNLSGGEKAAFDLLLDIHVKKKFFPDAAYCIDELETHLHTKVQGRLLKEIVKILPGDSQLWVTTHSLGVLRAAQEMAADDPGSVCVIDFDPINPDESREIVPSNLGRVSWEKMLSVALDDLSERVAPKVLVICEGSSVGNRRRDFDAEIYNRILGSHAPGVVFISGGSSNQVTGSGISVRDTMREILPSTAIVALCDRDDKSEAEVTEVEQGACFVLSERNLESFLFADDVIEALVQRENKMSLLGEALKIKADAINESVTVRQNPPDDIKSAAGKIYTGLKTLLQLTRCGNNTDNFMRDTLAPLIVPGMSTYAALRAAIIERLEGLG
jgi:predicted ATPase